MGPWALRSRQDVFQHVQRSVSSMAEVGPATSRRTRTVDSYANQWNRFVAWSQAAGRRCLPPLRKM